MMSFNPKEHMIKLSGKDYLETKWRIVWFREVHPLGAITARAWQVEDGLAMAESEIRVDGQIIATGTASADSRKKKPIWAGKEVMKAETAAIGRALAHAGYGTQFTGEDEGEFLADSPVEQARQKPQPQAPKAWANKTTITAILEEFREHSLSDGEIFKLAGVEKFNDPAWNEKYDSYGHAVVAINEALGAHVESLERGDPGVIEDTNQHQPHPDDNDPNF